MDSLKILQSKGYLKSADSYILTNKQKQELVSAFNSLAKINKVELRHVKGRMEPDDVDILTLDPELETEIDILTLDSELETEIDILTLDPELETEIDILN